MPRIVPNSKFWIGSTELCTITDLWRAVVPVRTFSCFLVQSVLFAPPDIENYFVICIFLTSMYVGTDLIIVTDITDYIPGEKSVMWGNFRFL